MPLNLILFSKSTGLKQMMFLFLWITLCGSFLSLNGCSLFKPEKQVTLDIRSAHYINPNRLQKACDLAVRVYILSDPIHFNHATYAELITHSSQILKQTLLDEYRYLITPDDHQVIPISLPANAHYLGVVVGYQAMNLAHWRYLIKRHWLDKRYQLMIETNSMTITTQRTPWS